MGKKRPLPPGDLEPEERRLWSILLSDLPENKIERLDECLLLELMTCHMMLRKMRPQWAANPEDKTLRINYLDTQRQFLQLSERFGMSPKGRQKLNLEESADDDNPFGELLTRFTG